MHANTKNNIQKKEDLFSVLNQIVDSKISVFFDQLNHKIDKLEKINQDILQKCSNQARFDTFLKHQKGDHFRGPAGEASEASPGGLLEPPGASWQHYFRQVLHCVLHPEGAQRKPPKPKFLFVICIQRRATKVYEKSVLLKKIQKKKIRTGNVKWIKDFQKINIPNTRLLS